MDPTRRDLSPPITFNNFEVGAHQFLKGPLDNIESDLLILGELRLDYIIYQRPLFFVVLDMDVLVRGIDQVGDIDIAQRSFKGGGVKDTRIEIERLDLLLFRGRQK